MDVLYLSIILASHVLLVRSQTGCNVAAIQQCTERYASTISSEAQPTVAVICRAYSGFQSCIVPFQDECRGNPMYTQLEKAQSSIASQCSALGDCDADAITTCYTDYANAVQNARTRLQTCRLVSSLRRCISPHMESCKNFPGLQQVLSAFEVTRETCGDPEGCDENAVSSCYSDYADGNPRTRLQTCRLVSALRRCVRPHMENCKNSPGLQEVLSVFEGTRETCGDPEGCDENAVSSCYSDYADGNPRTRLQTCRLVSALRRCIRPHMESCKNSPGLQQVLSVFEGTRETCGDPGSCDDNAVLNCYTNYSNGNPRTRLQTCRLVSALRRCIRPHMGNCKNSPGLQQVLSVFEGTRDTCGDGGTTSMCNTQAISDCMAQFSLSSGAAQTRLESCRLVASLRKCIDPHRDECENEPSFQQVLLMFRNTDHICSDGSSGVTCNIQAVGDCMRDYKSSITSTTTKAQTCRVVSSLRDCVTPYMNDCEDDTTMLNAVTILRNYRDTCTDLPGSSCQTEVLTNCLRQYKSSVASARTRLHTCRAVSSLSNCVRPHSRACQQSPEYQPIQAIFQNTEEICQDGSEGNCNVDAVSDCMAKYTSSSRSARTRLGACRAYRKLERCLKPLEQDCQGSNVMDSVETIRLTMRETCSEGEFEEYCQDWNNTRIPSGEIFSPDRNEPCNRCMCDNGFMVACKEVACLPPNCPGAQQVPDTCCEFICPILPPTPGTEPGATCLDWNNTVIQSGDIFSPRRSDPCEKCYCSNGRTEYCKMIHCDAPPCLGAILIPDTCCGFTCPPTEEPVAEGQRTCRDWNNTLIQHGERFSPREGQPCYRCECDNGNERYCRMVYCDAPPCRGARLIPGTCCGFICPPTEEPVVEGQSSCRDWNNTLIQHGERFSPRESQPCYRCECDNGNERYCRMVYCDEPPCRGARPIPGTCCGFICPVERQPELEPVLESSSTCRDWNNTIIRNGAMYSPRENDLCHRCMCDNGQMRYCKTVYCDVPSCPGARPLPGVCCGFICPAAIELPSTTPEPEPTDRDCPEGWTKHEDKCYYVSRDKLSWASSQVICKSINGKLVEITSEEENSFLKDLASSEGVTNYWIGVTDLEVAGTYKFPGKATALEYADWKRRTPPKHKTYNCVEVKKARVFNWRPTKCTKRINFVCQRYP